MSSNYNEEDPIKFFTSTMKTAFKIFGIAIALGLISSYIATIFDNIEKPFFEDTANRVSDAFNTVAAASLTGAMFISLNYFKNQCKD